MVSYKPARIRHNLLSFTLIAGVAGLTGSAASAVTLNLSDGSVADVNESAIGQGGTGTLTGTITQNGQTENVNCVFDATQGTVTGSPACAQIVGGAGTGGLNLADLESRVVGSRLAVAADLNNETQVRLFDTLIERRLGAQIAVSAQASAQSSSGAGSASFGSPTFGSFGFAGGSFFDDGRLGREKDGENYVLTAGIDRSGDSVLFGAYVGYIESDVDLESLAGNLSSDGWSLGGYATVIANDVLSFTASASHTSSDIKTERTVAGALVTADYDQSEWYGSINANAFWLVNNLGVSMLAGLSYGDWSTDAYTDTRGIIFGDADGDNTTARLGTTLTLFASDTVRPYATATYSHLLSDQAFDQDRGALNVGGGISFGNGPLTASVEATTLLLKEDIDSTTLGLHIRLAL